MAGYGLGGVEIERLDIENVREKRSFGGTTGVMHAGRRAQRWGRTQAVSTRADGPDVTPLAPLDAVLSLLATHLAPVPASTVALADALGMVLAADVLAPAALPATAIALIDGIAVAAADTVGAGPYAPALPSRPPVRVAAGDALPQGCDAVLPAGALLREGPVTLLLAEAAPGFGTRRPGEDLAAGTVILRAGHRLDPLRMGLAAACDIGVVAVRVPRVIVEGHPDGTAVGVFTDAALRAAGAVPMRAGSAIDDAELILSVAFAAGDNSLAGRLALRPGETGGVALRDGRIVIRLPARLEEAVAVWHALVSPALERLAAADPTTTQIRPLGRKLASAVGVCDIVLLATNGDAWDPLAVGDLPWSALARAEAVALTEAGSEGAPAGSLFAARPL
jgi:molybdopterin biosynthesis enzyme